MSDTRRAWNNLKCMLVNSQPLLFDLIYLYRVDVTIRESKEVRVWDRHMASEMKHHMTWNKWHQSRKRKDGKLCVVRQIPGKQERHLFFSSVKTLLLNLQITDKSFLPLSCSVSTPTHSHSSASSSSPRADRQPAERPNLPFYLLWKTASST